MTPHLWFPLGLTSFVHTCPRRLAVRFPHLHREGVAVKCPSPVHPQVPHLPLREIASSHLCHSGFRLKSTTKCCRYDLPLRDGCSIDPISSRQGWQRNAFFDKNEMDLKVSSNDHDSPNTIQIKQNSLQHTLFCKNKQLHVHCCPFFSLVRVP